MDCEAAGGSHARYNMDDQRSGVCHCKAINAGGFGSRLAPKNSFKPLPQPGAA